MEWFKGGVGEAISEAKARRAVFVVVVKGEESEEATKSLETLLEDAEISRGFSSMVCIEVINGSPTCAQFSAIYPVLLIPSIYFIDSNTGVDLEILGGMITKEKIISSIRKTSEKIAPVESIQAQPSITVPVNDNEEGSLVETSLPCTRGVPSSDDNEQSASSQDTTASGSSKATSLEERVAKAKALAAQRQAEREESEKNKEKNAEMERRKMGKDMAEVKARRDEQEAKEAALQRKKDKEEERKAKEAVKAAIEQDRLARKVKYDAEKKVSEEKKKEADKKKLEEAAAEAEASAIARATISRLQFRLPDGRNQTKQFPAETSLSEVYSFVAAEVIDKNFGSFSLKTTFPRLSLDSSPKDSSLRDLSLVPSATVLVLPAGGALSSSSGGLLSFLWLLLSPLTIIWGMIQSLLSGASSGSSSNVHSSSSNAPPPARMGRIRNSDDDDDENNTWNGNSTQQM